MNEARSRLHKPHTILKFPATFYSLLWKTNTGLSEYQKCIIKANMSEYLDILWTTPWDNYKKCYVLYIEWSVFCMSLWFWDMLLSLAFLHKVHLKQRDFCLLECLLLVCLFNLMLVTTLIRQYYRYS